MRPEQIRKRGQHRRAELALPGLIGRGDAGELRREVRQNQVGGSPETLAHRAEDRRIADVAAHRVDVGCGQRVDGYDVDADRSPVGADPFHGHLEPAARPGPEVDDVIAATEQTEAVRELDELVGAAGTVARGARATVVAVLRPVRHSRRRPAARGASTLRALRRDTGRS